MSYTIHDPRVFYAAIESRLSTQTSKPVGRSEAPAGVPPYAVVYPLDDTGTPTSLGDAHETTVYEFQVTSVGTTEEQALWMQHAARTALAGWTPTVAGRSFNPIEKAGGRAVRRDDGLAEALFSAVDIFTVFTS